MQVALTIAGFDPSSGAGITADLAVFAAHGLYGTACITAATVQSTRGVRSVHPTDSNLLRDTLDELCADLPPSGIKIGMLGSTAVLDAVIAFLERLPRAPWTPVILDPILRSSSGHPLLPPDALDLLRTRLLPLVTAATPNVAELAALLGREIDTADEILAGARDLVAQQGTDSALTLIVTGGDRERPDDLVLTASGQVLWLSGNRGATTSTHGTGCAFSSALLSGHLAGHEFPEAARRAKAYVEEALRRAPALGQGRGPLSLLWPLHNPKAPT